MMCALLLLLVLLFILVCQCNRREGLGEPATYPPKFVKGRDGITRGFEDPAKNQLDMLKNVFTSKI